jgi:prevent-host-death family protein
MASSKVAEAKSRFGELIDRAMREGAQEITRHGRRAVVIVSAEEWDRKTRRNEGLVQFLDRSPLRGSDLEVERLPDPAPGTGSPPGSTTSARNASKAGSSPSIGP